ncbi:MAG: hypothetical protein AAGE43_04720 [Pseudomonadota bacterium]
MFKLNALGSFWQQRPWWLNGVWLFCLYMTFVYMPWDMFWKSQEQWEEVWFGFTLRGWPAKLTEPIHWAIYAAGSYGIWKMKSWLWPWMALYCGQIAVAMLIFNIIAGPGVGDGRGGGLLAGAILFIAFSWLTATLWRAKPLFRN